MRFALALPCLALATVAYGVEHATIAVDGSGVPTKTGGTAGFFLDAGQTTGEYPIRIGASAADDAAGGVLIGAVSQGARNSNYGSGGTVRDSSPNSNNSRGTAGALALSATKAGADEPVDAGNPANFNMSAGYFPFADGWQGGSLYSSTVNNDATFGTLDTLVASGGVAVTANYLDQPGVSRVTIPGVTDAARQGVLVSSVASNVGRFAAVAPSLDNDAYIVRTVDNDGYFEFDPSLDPGQFGEGNGFDTPHSFVFVPKGTPGVTLARVATHGNTMTLGEQVGVPLVHSGADFSVTSNNLTGPGRFRLEIAGFTPADGTLLVTPEGASEIPGAPSSDNLLTYEADATGWTILSQDLEADALYTGEGDPAVLDGTGQASDGAGGYFSFVFVPNTGAPTAPGPIQSAASLTNFNSGRVIGWNTQMLSFSGDNNNDNGSTAAVIPGGGTQKTADVRIDQFANRGDVPVAVDGKFLSVRDGLLIATISEGFRDNSVIGGAQDFGNASTTGFRDNWGIALSSANNIPGEDEHNINYSAAFFGRDAGFQMTIAAEIDGNFGAPLDEGKLDVDLPGVNSLTDGVLIATSYENGDNYVTAEPKADGSGWEVRSFDNTHDVNGGRNEPDNVSWVYLPYDAENLVAGLVDVDGSVLSGTAGAGTDWTITRELSVFNLPQYRLSFTDSDKSPADGMLLLTSTGEFAGLENQDNSMVYEADGSDFIISGIDHVVGPAGAPGPIPSPEETGFMFAYIDFDDAPAIVNPRALPGDFNADGRVDAADYTVWRDNVDAEAAGDNLGDENEAAIAWNGDGRFGIDLGDYEVWAANYGATLPGALTSIPEPTALALGLVAMGFLKTHRRRS